MNRLTKSTVVVTAGYGDIGRATCRRCCEEGATVIMTGRKPVKEGAAIARRTQAEARRALPAKALKTKIATVGTIEYMWCDAGDRACIDTMLNAVKKRHQRIDVVIGNAAMVENGPFLKIRPDQWQAHLDLNLTGNFHLGQAAARIMVKQNSQKKTGCKRGVRGRSCLTVPGSRICPGRKAAATACPRQDSSSWPKPWLMNWRFTVSE